MQAAALSHLDRSVSSGTFRMRPELPYIGGVEGSGVVLEADDIPTGSRVLVRGAGVGLLRDGTWCEEVSVPRKSVTVLPQELPPEVGATFYQPASTAYIALNDVARLSTEERVVVVGAAGAVGSQVVQQALSVGAEVIGVVRTDEHREQVPHGAKVVMLNDLEATSQMSQERSATLLVDTIGGADIAVRTAWIQPGGRAVVIGYVAGESAALDLPSWLLHDVALLPLNMIRREKRAREVMPGLIDKLVTGELAIQVQSFQLADIAEGLERLHRGTMRGRGVILFDES